MLRSGWNLPDGLMFIPEEKEKLFDPDCSRCYGEGTYDIDIQPQEGGSIMSVPQDCDCGKTTTQEIAILEMNITTKIGGSRQWPGV